MEVLIRKLEESQNSLEDAFRLEIDYDEVKLTKDGKRLLSYLRKRRRVIESVVKMLNRF